MNLARMMIQIAQGFGMHIPEVIPIDMIFNVELPVGVKLILLVSQLGEFIKLELSVREPILDPVERKPARTLLEDPLRNEPAVMAFSVHVLSFRETYAEKCRAALTRRMPAIRDFYDIDHAVRTKELDPADAGLLKLVRQKLVVPGNRPIDSSQQKLDVLTRQLEPELKPVLRGKDFEGFDLDRAFGIVKDLAEAL